MSQTATRPENTTPAGAINNRQEMKPLPLRVATRQYERLCRARDRSGISIQEHIRRSIDIYLASIEREAIELGMMSATDQFPGMQSRLPQAPTRVAKR